MNQTSRLWYSTGLVVLIAIGAYLHSVHLAPDPYTLWENVRLMWWSLFAATHLVLSYVFGLPDLARSRGGAVGRGLGATIGSFLVISTCQTALATPLLPRSSSVLAAVILPTWALVGCHLSQDVSARAAARDRVFAVVGREEDARVLEVDLAGALERPATLAGWLVVDDVTASAGTQLVTAYGQAEAGLLVLDTGAQGSTAVVEQASQLHRSGHRVRPLTLFYEDWLGKLPHSELARTSLLFDIGELHRIRYVRAKRVVDLAFAAVGAIVLLIMAPMVAAANRFWNRGPLLFRQMRVGKDGVPFEIFKLRTMTPAADGSASAPSEQWTLLNDERITPLGRLLRQSHLDELPQVLNIFRGELSLVGPRPEQPHYVEELTDKIAFFDPRHAVLPGITGRRGR